MDIMFRLFIVPAAFILLLGFIVAVLMPALGGN